MNTLRLTTSDADTQKAAELLKQGKLVAFPTETVYGLGASVFNQAAIQNIYFVKGRPSDNPLIAHIADVTEIETIANIEPVERLYHLLAEAFWPGPFTVILPRKDTVPDSISAGLATIAVRLPDHPVARALIRAAGTPLVAPSANLSGKPSPTSAEHVLEDLDGAIAAVIDGGDCTVGIESTVLDITTSPIILRPGAITQEQIEQVLRMPIAHAVGMSEQQAVSSPGMKYKHYAPQTPIELITPEQLQTTIQQHPQALFLCSSPSGLSGAIHSETLTMQNFYRALRLADSQQLPTIYIVMDNQVQKNLGLVNRILKAAGKDTL